MRWIHLLIVLALGQGILSAEAVINTEMATDRNVEFKALSDIEQKRDILQRDRFHKRQDVIESLLKKIQSAWDKGDEKVLETEIPILGDECLNLFAIADLKEKEVKKLKRKGYRINSLCESLFKKIQEGPYGKYEKKWSDIKARTELFLKQSKGI